MNDSRVILLSVTVFGIATRVYAQGQNHQPQIKIISRLIVLGRPVHRDISTSMYKIAARLNRSNK